MPPDSDVEWWRRIIVRRERGRAIEILPGTTTPIQVTSWADGESSVYGVSLPPGAALIPDDCRRIAYQHDLVHARLATCVRDNVRDAPLYASEPEFGERLGDRLRLALGDLRLVFDVVAVRVSRDVEGLRVDVEGDFKNGERGSARFSVAD